MRVAKMSGHANYDDALNPIYKIVDVPLRIANRETVEKFGRLVHDFDKEEVWITPWPCHGTRKLYPGTGVNGGIVSGAFEYRWEGEVLKAINNAVPDGDYVTGRLPADVSPERRTYVLTREANYHPDGGQVFYPTNGGAFVLLLAEPGDAIKPEDFVAFYFDGSCGMQIKAGIWHQPAYPVDDTAVFKGKQGAVYACVVVDTAQEFETYLRVPLNAKLAS